jgi:phosphoribosylglycinamide formyltransferase-1
LQALIDAQGNVLRSGEITLVVSNAQGAYALERAKKAGITTETVIKKDWTVPNWLSPSLRSAWQLW